MTSVAASDMIHVEELPSGWETAKVTYRTKEGELKASIQLIDTKANPPVQYWYDSMRSISIKCALLVLGIPLFVVASGAFHMVRTLVLFVGTLVRSACCLIDPRNWGQVDRICLEWTKETSDILCKGGAQMVRLLFAIQMEWYCLYGIFFPLEGRLLAGEAERAIKGPYWAGDLEVAIEMRTKDLRSTKDVMSALIDLFTNKNSEYRFYWAFCFQPVAFAQVKDRVLQIDRLDPGMRPR